MQAATRARQDLTLENLLLRHQLAVLTRPTRRRSHARLRVWDKLLGLNLFSPEVARKEIAFYLTKQNQYGLSLDNRRDYTKLDWIWRTATLAEKPSAFSKLVSPVYRFVNESPSRVPLTDWYDTVTGKQQGFQARSVVGGVFVKMLADPAMWKKYSSRGQANASPR